MGEVRNSLVVEPVVEQSNGVRLTSEAVSAESTIEESLISALGKRELRGLKQTEGVEPVKESKGKCNSRFSRVALGV